MPRLVALLALGLVTMASGAVVEDFERPGTWQVHRGDERGGSFAAVAAPAPRGRSGRLSWTVPHHAFLELHLARPVPLPALDGGFNGTLTVQVASGQPSMINRIALRLIDRDGEVFQFGQTVDLRDGAWHQLSFRLSPETVAESWGDQLNHRVDLPVRLLGFAVSFSATATAPGALHFDDIALSTPGQQVDTVRPLWRFDDQERWTVHPNWRQVAQLVPVDGGLTLEVSPVAKETGLPLTERGFGVRTLGTPASLTLRVELLAGAGASFSLRLRDARGEIHPFPSRPLKPGLNEVTWRFPEDRRTPTWGQNRDGVLDAPYWLHELWYSQAPTTQPVRVRLISAETRCRQPLLEAVKVDVETGNPIHVLKRGEEATLALRLTNQATTALPVSLHVELENYAGRRVASDLAATIPAQGSTTAKLPHGPDAQGIWWVHYLLRDPASGAELPGRTSFALMQPAGPTPGRAPGFLFSICTHTERWPEADQEKEILAAGLCGAKVMRTGEGWGTLQPTSDRWEWSRLDKLVQRYGEQGMELQLLLGFNPRWAVDGDVAAGDWLLWSRKMPRLEPWRAYCTAMAQRYGDRVRYWEVWNEPDIDFWRGTLDEYLQLLQASYESIKAVDPKLQVMTGGFACYDRNPRFVEGVVDRGQQWFDIFAYHRHGDFAGFRQEVDGPVAAMRARLQPPKPLYFNETAIASLAGGERVQAETLVKKLTFAWSRGSIGYTWYDLRNDGFDPKDWEHHYGLLTNDFYPKAVYPTFNTLALLLTDKRYEQELALGDHRFGFVFGSEREQVVATWSEPVAGPARHYILQTDASTAATVDLMGNRTAVPVLPGGRVILVNEATPAYLVLTGAKARPTIAGPLANLGGPYVAVPGRKLPLEAAFANPLARAGRLHLSWTAPAGWQVEPAVDTVSLPAEGRARVAPTLLVRRPSDRRRRTGELGLRYEVPGTPLAGTVSVPVEVATIVDDRRADRPADFELADSRDVVNLYGNDPMKGHLTWQGPLDLSARIWLSRSADALHLRVAVRDDVHVQREPAPFWWRGDSVQCGLVVPGQDGYWELMLARGDDGRPLVGTTARPRGAADPAAAVTLATRAATGEVVYDATLPYRVFGLTPASLRQGVRFNLLVNDNDGEGRESWVEIAPGIGRSKDPTRFGVVVFE